MTVAPAALLTASQARDLTDQIRHRVTDLLPMIKEAFDGRADQALGYASWADYCAAELSGVRVPLEDRPALVAELRQNGMSQRAIGSALGIAQDTVRRDLSQLNDSVQLPETVTSLDGRERPAAMPARQDLADAIVSAIDEALPQPVSRKAEPVSPQTQAVLDETYRRVGPLNSIATGCQLLLTQVHGIDPVAAIENAPTHMRADLAIARDALEFLTRVVSALKPAEVPA